MAGRQSNFQELIAQFESDSPFGPDVLKLFRAAGARVTWVTPVRQAAPPHSWVLHVRLPGHLEEHFALTRQFLVYCAATADLQVRETTRVQALMRDAADTVQPDIAVLLTDDPLTSQKIDDWAVDRTQGIVVVPVYAQSLRELLAADSSGALRTLIEQQISARNLYDERDPVTGSRFYGRAELLRDLDRQLADGRGHVGLFGLRRIGKTSVLLELKSRLQMRPNVVPIFVDLQSATGGAGHAAHRVSEEFANALSEVSSLTRPAARRELRVHDDWSGADGRMLIARLADSARALLLEGALRGKHVVLMLDEAEMLLPDPNRPVEYAIDFFRALRGVAQETQRLSLVLAGVNATPTESPFLAGEDNPLFGLLSPEYLGPLAQPECAEMIRRVGRRMQVRWEDPVVRELTHGVGSHPLLARLAASEVVTAATARPLRPNLGDVKPVLDAFPERQSSIFEQMLQSLKNYYPDELDFLTILASGDVEFAQELGKQSPVLLNHLEGYGVLDREDLSVSIPVLREWLERHAIS